MRNRGLLRFIFIFLFYIFICSKHYKKMFCLNSQFPRVFLY
ncbi:unnamed protein product [Schistosoma mattheei]|uniref:Uncharacterized protein n=1 Tax=Schistosoma mattheei TaxID=31246 RepID=A0A183P3I2_9TREM|nr:unnamed protein product [Schistosoma mattheei]